MASRYWVGGTASWDATAGTKWALTSGGAGGQAVPTSADDVFFDAASGAVTVTIGGTRDSLSLNFTGFTGTVTDNGSLQVYGSLTLVSGTTWSHTGNVLMIASSGSWTVATAGKTLGANISFGLAASTGTWTLQDSLSVTGAVTVTGGTFTTNNFNVTTTSLSSSNSNTRTINLGSSTVTFSGGTPVNFTTNTGLTLNAGTSTTICTSSAASFITGASSSTGVTFYNVSFTGTGGGASHYIQGISSFNNLSVAAPASAGYSTLRFDGNQTINGTLSTTGTAGNQRVWFRSLTYGIAYTLTINSAPSLTDADFRDLYVIGTAAPISGTRIGNLRGCSGITFDAAKSVYWNLAGAQNWSANGWAPTSGGTPATTSFPLAQDTAVFDNTGSVTGTITMDAAIPYTGTVDMSARSSAMTLATTATVFTIYGDWKNGSGTTLSGTFALTFSGRNTQSITSATKAFTQPITIDTYGGTVQLVDTLDIGTQPLTVTNGTFATNGQAVTATSLASSNSNVRAINLGASTITLNAGSTALSISNPTNLTFNSGSSTINMTVNGGLTFAGGGLTFNNVSFNGTAAATYTMTGANTFANLTFTAPAAAGLMQCTFSANQTITGTLTCAGATAVRRIFLRSDTLGTQRTLTVGTLSAQDCDFRDIVIAGGAAGSSPTRAGDCGGNSGITFPGAKTVYWNLAGAQNWSATGWCPSSGGTPDINQFPLAQDTAVFDNTGSVTGTITVQLAWNIGTFDASARTSAMTISFSTPGPNVYGNWKWGTGATSASTAVSITFSGRGTQTITSNGVSFATNVTIDSVTGTVQLADALTLGSTRTLTLNSGTFDAVSYNVSTGLLSSPGTTVLKMGSGTWTLSGTSFVWLYTAGTLNKGTANIILSDTSTTARTFAGNGYSYNKLTIGGTTGISTTSITGSNQFTELASTKTVAHTITLDSGGTTTVGAWTITGTVGNVVTVNGTSTTTIIVAGARVSGVDYLALGTTTLSATSPGEFYAGANSTGGTRFTLTAAPAATTRYWVGGTGSWDATTTTNWSASSGGATGASVPTSADAVVFDTLSNATAYGVTVTATARCAALTVAGPAVGNLTLVGTVNIPLIIHGNATFPATGLASPVNMAGGMVLSGSATGKTFTTNGVAFTANTDVIQINGIGSGWTLGGATNLGTNAGINVVNGSFATANYSVTAAYLNATGSNTTSIDLGSSTFSMSGSSIPVGFGFTAAQVANLTFNAGTSTLNCSQSGPTFQGNGKTFYNVSFTTTSANTVAIYGANTFNNLSSTGITSAGLKIISLNANQTISGTLTLSAGTDATMRTFVQSSTLGTAYTLTCAAFAGTDADFRDITIAGAAAPVSGTRLGDAKGNSGITFGAGVNKYWNLAAGGNWSATGWATSGGGTPAANNFPLAQDTAIFQSTGLNSGATITVNAAYNIGTIDMSARTTNTMTLNVGLTNAIYGNWINGSGVTFSNTGTITFAGRGSQTITSAGVTFTQAISINTPGGSVTLADAFSSNFNGNTIILLYGTFSAASYNVSITGASAAVIGNGSNLRTLNVGSGTWTIVSNSIGWQTTTITNLTISGTGTISLTGASGKSFQGGGASYSGITLNQGGAGTLTISGNNTFKNITNTYSATGATAIAFAATITTLSQFTAAGTSGKLLTISGTSAASPATLIYTGASTVGSDYLTVNNVRAYSLSTTWYAGANSTNGGSLGWIYSALPSTGSSSSFFFMF